MTEQFIKEIHKQFKKNTDILIKKCESEIEKLLLIKIINYALSRPDIFAIGFIFRDIETFEEANKTFTTESPNYYLKSSSNYPGILEGLRLIDIISKRVIEIFPQTLKESVSFQGKHGFKEYRLDFGVFIYDFSESKNLLKKVCIECDGFEYHNTKEAIIRDNDRMRNLLLLDGYTTLRFLGTEIFNWDEENVGMLLQGMMH